ncbi:hypothetical protein ACFTXM_14340 [Streptomyces sp. NPDC056930]|uniref:hypothetical protein n=1 Tax=Streptomyces sp. NPDC056930 TaxID=3345967 RepID=UPI00363FB0D6
MHLVIRRDHGYDLPGRLRPDGARQAHLRILVAHGDLDEAEREGVSLGAMPMEAKVGGVL